MTEFDEKPVCKKCGCAVVKIRFEANASGEYLWVVCDRCSCSWRMKTKDAVKA